MDHVKLFERRITLFNVQKYNTSDGPGVRTLLFFQGCPLRCRWCANPEGLERRYRILYKKNQCINCGACVDVCPAGIHTLSTMRIHEINRELECKGCRRCAKACVSSALAIAGEQKSVSELMKIIEDDQAFYDLSGGGVTLGGGEVLMQPEAAVSLLAACRQEGIHTSVETSGYAQLETLMKVAEFTDLFLYDIKHIDPDRHYFYTGVRNELILNNLYALLNNRYNVKIRMPLLYNINTSYDDITGVAKYLQPFRVYKNFHGIDLLPYHKFGINKYAHLGMEYPIKADASVSKEKLSEIKNWLEQYSLSVTVIGH